LMRCSPIGFLECFDTEFIIVKESMDYPCQNIKSCINSKNINSLKNNKEGKNPELLFLDETYHKDYNIESVSHDCEHIDWDKYNIIITINACVPCKITKIYTNILWCYYVGENNGGELYNLLDGYDLILNQNMNDTLPNSVNIPYSFISPNTIEKMNSDYLNITSNKNGIYLEINNTQERPFLTIPIDFIHIQNVCKIPIVLHSQNIIENIKRIYQSKYFVKIYGRKIRGNGILEVISAGTLILINKNLLMYNDLISDNCHVENINDIIQKIIFFENNLTEYNSMIKMQKQLMDEKYFKEPIKNIIHKYEKKQQTILP